MIINFLTVQSLEIDINNLSFFLSVFFKQNLQFNLLVDFVIPGAMLNIVTHSIIKKLHYSENFNLKSFDINSIESDLLSTGGRNLAEKAANKTKR